MRDFLDELGIPMSIGDTQHARLMNLLRFLGAVRRERPDLWEQIKTFAKERSEAKR